VDELGVWLFAVGQWLACGAVGSLFLGVRHDDCDVVENPGKKTRSISGEFGGTKCGSPGFFLTCVMGSTELCLGAEAEV
jgi:hypothetical protein